MCGNFGVCQIGEFPSFDDENIDGCFDMIDIDAPFEEWIPLLQEIKRMYIVSLFRNECDIEKANAFVHICRNMNIFTTILTPKDAYREGQQYRSLLESVDVVIRLEDCYYEDDIISDPVSYAIWLVAEFFYSFFDIVLENDEDYDGIPYWFAKSGTAEIVTFSVLKQDYDKTRSYELPEEIKEKISGKRMALICFKPGDDPRVWPMELITRAVKAASGRMIFSNWRSASSQSRIKQPWVSVLLSNLDNPSNNYEKRHRISPQHLI